MHEWALAEAVLESVLGQLKREADERGYGGRSAEATPLRVSKVTLLFGELQSIDSEIFFEGLKNLAESYPFEADIFEIETEKALFRCRSCGTAWPLDSVEEEAGEAIHFVPEMAHVFLRCPSCGSPDFILAAGRGVTIKSIVLEAEDPPD
jgi:hydrogenase nickel incorporation protein HypA/HybF